MPTSRSAVALALVSLILACSSSAPSGGADGGSSWEEPGAGSCPSALPDLCVALPVEALNRACEASFYEPLGQAEPFTVSGGGYFASQCAYDNDPQNAADPLVQVGRECYSNGVDWVVEDDPGTELEPKSTEVVTGIGDEAFYRFSDDSIVEYQYLFARQGNVVFEAQVLGAIGTREDMKACLATVVKQLIAATPAK